jgi:hypothetical protein
LGPGERKICPHDYKTLMTKHGNVWWSITMQFFCQKKA